MGRATARTAGELLVTAGALLLLFVAYQLVWTNVEAGRAQDRVTEQIRDDWDRPPADPGGPGDPGPTKAGGTRNRVTAAPGEGFAFLRIPRLGSGYQVPVLEGVELDVLARGVGHYPGTAGPGGLGNFAVAGHRATNGEPFAYLDQVRPGDVVVTETQRAWFTYVVDRTRIVRPTDTWVIDPVPGEEGAAPTDRLLTLTTCNPRWASTERLIVFAHLQDRRPRSEGPPDELTRES